MNNELVNRLALQAKENVPKDTLNPDAWIEHYNQQLVKLVVLECVNIVDNLDEAYDAPSTAGKMLKQFFGLKND